MAYSQRCFDEDGVNWVLRNRDYFEDNFNQFVDSQVHETIHDDVDGTVETFMRVGHRILAFRSCYVEGNLRNITRAMLENVYYVAFLHGMRYGMRYCPQDYRFLQYRSAVLALATFVADKRPANEWDEIALDHAHMLVTALKRL